MTASLMVHKMHLLHKIYLQIKKHQILDDDIVLTQHLWSKERGMSNRFVSFSSKIQLESFMYQQTVFCALSLLSCYGE